MNTPSAMDPTPVRIVDVKMPFGSMILFMVKWAIAAIPAFIILALIGAILAGIVTAMFSGGAHH